MTTTSEQEKTDPLRLKIDAHVIQQLGAELISGPDIALLELVKNSHDADASFCHIEINTNYIEKIGERTYKGKITIQDNGHGMTRDVINKSWLTVSYSEKRAAKLNKTLTNKYKRTFTGDKGLGRLGSMQLGDLCRITTHALPSEEGICVSFDWSDFKQGLTLDSISVTEFNIPPRKATGTMLEIIGLKDIDTWEHNLSISKMTTKLSSMISPHGQISKFKTYFTHNGTPYSMQAISDDLLKQHSSIFKFDFDEDDITVLGSFDYKFFKPNSDLLGPYNSYIARDRGEELRAFLVDNRKLSNKGIRLNLDKSQRYSVSTSMTLNVKDIKYDRGFLFNNPGPFSGTIFNFILNKENLDLTELNLQEVRESIKNITGGISVYRDGFKIGSDKDDWLGLLKEKTSGSGSYSLRPSNVTGYLNLTWEQNSALKEKSDRESFVDNSEYRTFYKLATEIISLINTTLNELRRASLEFLKMKKLEGAGKPKSYSAKEASSEIREVTRKAAAAKPKLKKSIDKLNTEITSTEIDIAKIKEGYQTSLFEEPGLKDKLDDLEKKIVEVQKESKEHMTKYLHFTQELESLSLSADNIISEISSYERQIKNFYDHVAIGLSAQSLAHEINAQNRNINLHLNKAKERISSLSVKDTLLIKYLNSIKSDSESLSGAISSLHPLIRTQRETFEKINLSNYVLDYVKLRNDYFTGKNIHIMTKITGKEYDVKFNRGKLFQIIDNIVRNSEHWLENHQNFYPHDPYELHFLVDGLKVTIWDTARGVRPEIENTLFDMFASDKEHGQGLGLYITTSLLTERKCSIKLLDERNKFDRRYKFELNFVEAAV
ncbi:sensor histidine kinase [Vibrio atypicus]|uniref:sensor histidine kinase n=1 Tax=Vibrio atypicus TaxID=558271 RepID=UPI00135A3DFA|nr:sensor histidine kinase [Vibrio atypicus]